MTIHAPQHINQVRLLISDVQTGDDQYLDDDRIDTLLSLNDGNVRRAAADALEAIATSEVLVSKVTRTQDLNTDGTKVSAELRALAARHRVLADAADDRADDFGLVTAFPPSHRRPEAAEREVWGL